MPWLAGVDGCRAGWFRASRHTETGKLAFDLVEKAAELLVRRPVPQVVAIDIPIGLPDAGPRDADRQARARLGPARGRSVFPAPIRLALEAATYAAACAANERADGRRMSRQAWNLVPKIREVDEWLANDARARARLFEVHPELAFLAWNDGRAMAAPKKRPEGRAERLRLVERWLGPGVLAHARGPHPKSALADDDVLDAVAALRSAHRIAQGAAETLPAKPARDAAGLPMRIVF